MRETSYRSNRSLVSFFIQYLNENRYRLTSNFEGTGLEHHGYELFPPIVHWRAQELIY